jgi:glycosyltransferase involved in cell wall biosynthesis
VNLPEGMLPEMSVVMVTPDHYETVRKTIRYLREQTVKDRLEVVIVAPSADELGIDELELKDFPQVRVVEVDRISSTGGAIAAGLRRASAPVVAYAEEHSYPDPRWAEALIQAHRQPWAAVGGVLANANPGSMISWASLLTDFAPFMEPAVAGETDSLPWHHAAYKRAILLEYGSMLQTMLETEGILHRDLRARGYRLYLEPAAKSHHLNISLLSSYIRAELHGGRLFGAARARYGRWSILRRLLYIGGMPLIPLVRLWRILREVRGPGRPSYLLLRALPPMILGLVAHATGEVAGYAFGAGNSAQCRLTFELNRQRHVAEHDRQAGAEKVSEKVC